MYLTQKIVKYYEDIHFYKVKLPAAVKTINNQASK